MCEISVIIPSYCSSQRHGYNNLFLALLGYSNQSLSRDLYEVIIVDDGSDWELKNLINLWKFNFSHTIIRQPHTGMCSAFEAGIKKARGKYILLGIDENIPSKDTLKQHLEQLEDADENSIIWGRIYHMRHTKAVIDPVPSTTLNAFKDFTSKLKDIAQEDDSYCVSEKDVLENFHQLILASEIIERNLEAESLICDKEGMKEFSCPWLLMRLGNISLRKSFLNKVGGFDINFDPLGFYSIYELGIRLFKERAQILFNKYALMVHVSDFSYSSTKVERDKEYEYFYEKHPLLEVAMLPLFIGLSTSCSIKEFIFYLEKAKKITRMQLRK